MKESTLTAKIKRELEDAGAKVIKTRAGGVEAGTPDLIGCWRGKMFLLEIKVGKNKLTRLQVYRCNQWAGAGALASGANEAFDLAAFLECLRAHPPHPDAGVGVNPLYPVRRPQNARKQP